MLLTGETDTAQACIQQHNGMQPSDHHNRGCTACHAVAMIVIKFRHARVLHLPTRALYPLLEMSVCHLRHSTSCCCVQGDHSCVLLPYQLLSSSD